MQRQTHSLIPSLACATLLLSACGHENQLDPSNGDLSQPAQSRDQGPNQPVMGYVRWYDRESLLTTVECSDSDEHWQYDARTADVWVRASRNQQEPEHASIARTVIRMTIYRDGEPNPVFHILDNLTNEGRHLIGDISAGPEGISGRTLMIAANPAAGREYPFPEGIEVEFEMNCP